MVSIIKALRSKHYLIIGFITYLLSINVCTAGDNLPHYPKAKGDRCVEPVTEMKKNHMNYLLHKRDQTVHDGVRTKKYSLIECINCHASKNEAGQFKAINSDGQFCNSCHKYAAVKIDCFDCHATKPDSSDHSHVMNMHGFDKFKQVNKTDKLDVSNEIAFLLENTK